MYITNTKENTIIWFITVEGQVNGIMFIKIEDKLVNLNNVTAICKFNEKIIRICFIEERDYINIEKESEEELNNLWEWLEEVCIKWY